MDYNLARELKEAGFDDNRTASFCRNLDEEHCDLSCFPTLEELIEACGERFYFLKYDKNHPLFPLGGWTAQEIGTDNGIAEGNGATPKEAVARLWTALNKKV